MTINTAENYGSYVARPPTNVTNVSDTGNTGSPQGYDYYNLINIKSICMNINWIWIFIHNLKLQVFF